MEDLLGLYFTLMLHVYFKKYICSYIEKRIRKNEWMSFSKIKPSGLWWNRYIGWNVYDEVGTQDEMGMIKCLTYEQCRWIEKECNIFDKKTFLIIKINKDIPCELYQLHNIR